MRKPSLIALTLALALSMAGSSFAQISTGGIRGIVRDATGAVLVGVTVEAESPARIGGAAVAITNGQGLYLYQGLPVGVYTVTFTLHAEQLAFTGVDGRLVVEPGRHLVMVGTSAVDLPLEGEFAVVGEPRWLPSRSRFFSRVEVA